MTANTRQTAAESKSGLLEELRSEIEYLAAEIAIACADRDRLKAACNQWADVSQTNYQRAKVAEANLAIAVKALKSLEDKSIQQELVKLAHDAISRQRSEP